MTTLVNLSEGDVDSEYQVHGYEAFDAAGEKLGSIDSIIADEETMQPRYVVVDSGGWFSSKKFVVPAGDIRAIDDDRRHLSFTSLTKQTLQGGQYPRYDERWWDSNDHEHFSAHEEQVARAYQPDRQQGKAVDYSEKLYQRPAEGAQRLQLMEERLKVQKQQGQAGAVRIGKRITERAEMVAVTLREEHLIIERRPGNGTVTVDGRELNVGESIELTLMAEKVLVTKEPVVLEEVTVHKEVVERTEQVQATLRTQELVVDGDPALIEGDQSSPAGGSKPEQPRRS